MKVILSDEHKAYAKAVYERRKAHKLSLLAKAKDSLTYFNVRISNEDRQKYGKLNWCINADGALVTRLAGKTAYLHRLIVGAKPGDIVDHIDGNRLNVYQNNLRICDEAINAYNQKVGNIRGSSKYLGVSWESGKHKWCARLKVNKVNKRLGLFGSEVEAAQIYDKHKRALNIPNCTYNFPLAGERSALTGLIQ